MALVGVHLAIPKTQLLDSSRTCPIERLSVHYSLPGTNIEQKELDFLYYLVGVVNNNQAMNYVDV